MPNPRRMQMASAGAGGGESGTLYSWGAGGGGQLGHGNTSNLSVPTQVGSLDNWQNGGCGEDVSFMVNSDGKMYSCGNASYGATGQNNATNLSSLTQIGSLTNWLNNTVRDTHIISASRSHNGGAFVKSDGTLWVWGYNGAGGLGVGDTTTYSSPVQVGSLTNWHKVQWGNANLAALKTDNTLWGCGYGFAGQIGDGTNTNRSSPVQVGGAEWKDFGIQWAACVGIKTNGTLWGWGDADTGSLGRDQSSPANNSSPVQIGSASDWVKLGGGRYSLRAINSNGDLYVAGWNNAGQLGNGNTTNQNSLVQVGTGWHEVYTGSTHTIGIKTDGTMFGWGSNSTGQLGLGDTTSRSSPVQIGSESHWRRVLMGKTHTFALTGDQL